MLRRILGRPLETAQYVAASLVVLVQLARYEKLGGVRLSE
jgi:hypothetical protein